MAVSKDFLIAVEELLAFTAGLRTRRMFGGAGVFSEDMMFGLVADDVLYLKADDQNRAEFEAEGLAPFIFVDKAGQETPLGYRRAPESVWDDPDEAQRWASIGLGAALRAKARKR